MIRVYIIVEGQTEETFVNEVLAPELHTKQIHTIAKLIGKPGHQGGVLNYQRAKNDIIMFLKQDHTAYCTTMFDYFRLPNDFPGMPLGPILSTSEKAKVLEEAIYQDIRASMDENLRPDRFRPYIQMHEFEAMLFSNPNSFAKGICRGDLSEDFINIRKSFDTPEDIDDGPNTAPSKRIISFYPGYEKPTLGALAAIEIGLQSIRQQCPHFDEWVAKLEALGN